MSEPAPKRRILVIRLGALGNIVQSLGPFAAIRAHHPEARITLLTLPPYAEWMRTAPYFDEVWEDERPNWWNPTGLARLRQLLVSGEFDRVYDLQTSSRSSRYFRLFPLGRRPEWSGIARGCSHPDTARNRNRTHDLIRQANQLRQAGIIYTPPGDLSWCTGDIARFRLSGPYLLLVPGSSSTRPLKRWPIGNYAIIAADLLSEGITPVVIGAQSERDLGARLAADVPGVVDLTGQTSLGDIADLARAAVSAVGNDTGPTHLIAATNCRTVVLFSRDSNPSLCSPGGSDVRVVRSSDLTELHPSKVRAALERP